MDASSVIKLLKVLGRESGPAKFKAENLLGRGPQKVGRSRRRQFDWTKKPAPKPGLSQRPEAERLLKWMEKPMNKGKSSTQLRRLKEEVDAATLQKMNAPRNVSPDATLQNFVRKNVLSKIVQNAPTEGKLKVRDRLADAKRAVGQSLEQEAKEGLRYVGVGKIKEDRPPRYVEKDWNNKGQRNPVAAVLERFREPADIVRYKAEDGQTRARLENKKKYHPMERIRYSVFEPPPVGYVPPGWKKTVLPEARFLDKYLARRDVPFTAKNQVLKAMMQMPGFADLDMKDLRKYLPETADVLEWSVKKNNRDLLPPSKGGNPWPSAGNPQLRLAQVVSGTTPYPVVGRSKTPLPFQRAGGPAHPRTALEEVVRQKGTVTTKTRTEDATLTPVPLEGKAGMVYWLNQANSNKAAGYDARFAQTAAAEGYPTAVSKANERGARAFDGDIDAVESTSYQEGEAARQESKWKNDADREYETGYNAAAHAKKPSMKLGALANKARLDKETIPAWMRQSEDVDVRGNQGKKSLYLPDRLGKTVPEERKRGGKLYEVDRTGSNREKMKRKVEEEKKSKAEDEFERKNLQTEYDDVLPYISLLRKVAVERRLKGGVKVPPDVKALRLLNIPGVSPVRNAEVPNLRERRLNNVGVDPMTNEPIDPETEELLQLLGLI
jgi:hypothetical protein